ncbi:SETMR methyltransferase, partial [Acromyrmex charruanus]
MKKNEFRAVIKHLHMKDLTPKEIKVELDNVHSTSAPAFATVYNWVNEFKRGRTSTCDTLCSGHSIEAATPEIIDKVHDIVLTDRRVKVRELIEATGTVISILHEQLGMKKLSVRWMPRLLTVDLEMFQRNPDEFLHRFITVDKIWIYYFTPETKEQSKRRLLRDYYAALLDRFNNILNKKRSHLAKKKMLFHQDNARIHACPAPMVKFNEFCYELLPHPTYSPDLAPCDYFLFPNLKKWFGGKKVKKVESVAQSISAITHSYTIQPVISTDGRLLSSLLIVLKEPSRTLGPKVQETMFITNNIFMSKSDKLTSNHFEIWVREVHYPNVGSNSVLLLDSWTGHCPDIIQRNRPDSAQDIVLLTIPAGKIQPLDIFGFRLWKNFVKHFSDVVMLLDLDVKLYSINAILKLQSLTHNQFSSPRFTNLFKYAWYKSGYLEHRLREFDTPIF